MKFCTKCGEVYPSDVSTCNVDGAVLEMWTRTLFEAKDETRDHSLGGPQGRLVDSDDDAEVTNVEVMPYDDPPGQLTSKVSSSDIANGDVSGSTSIIDMRDPVTLAEFDVNSKVAAIDAGDNLVVYDDEVGGPFTGMLISNRYRLESRIGTGGFGVVFDAYDREEDKRVAVKVLSPSLSEDKRALMRFRREAIAVSRLEHPGIVSISDFGIEDEGVSYIVMEFLPGRDVAALLEDEKFLPAKRAARLVMQCAEALTAAHDEGVLHRDLKPANIFVIQNKDMVERIKIIDFGIAKDRSSNPRMKDITAASKVVGTPFYMSPEQASGHELDGRADVYSLGVILYELLTGERPFEGPSVYDILVAHGQAKRVKPSKVREELRTEGELDDIVLRAISAQREERFQSMDAFAEALRGYLEDDVGGRASGSSLSLALSLKPAVESTPAPPVKKTSNRVYEPGDRHPPQRVEGSFPIWTLAVAAVVLLAGVGYMLTRESNDTEPAGEVEQAETQGAPAPPAAVIYTAVTQEEDAVISEDAGPADAQAEEPTPNRKDRSKPKAKPVKSQDSAGGETKSEGNAGKNDDASDTGDAEEKNSSSTKTDKLHRKPKRKPKPKPKPKSDTPIDADAPIKERGIEEW